MQNYHRHTSYSNIYVADSAAVNEDYAKRAVELGHKVISSVEHGWQGYYFETYELAKKYDLKFIFGAEGLKIGTKRIVLMVISFCLQKMKMDGEQLTPSFQLQMKMAIISVHVLIWNCCLVCQRMT